jgi:hypothetical protein
MQREGWYFDKCGKEYIARAFFPHLEKQHFRPLALNRQFFPRRGNIQRLLDMLLCFTFLRQSVIFLVSDK